MKAERAILVYGMGITQHQRGAHNVQQIANLALLRGNVGREGAGVCPVRGHSNVQGDRTVGITEIPKADFLERLERRFGFKPPTEPGHNVVTALEAMIRGEVKVFFAIGGNFAAAIPDWQSTQAALRNLDLTVHVSTKLNRSHLIHGRDALILPCLGRTEIDIQAGGPQSITVEDSMSMVHASGGRNKPASEHLMSELAIVAGVAKATLGDRTVVEWDKFVGEYDLIRDAIEAVFPIFQGFNARIRVPGGFHLTSTARERIWATPSGKANFLVFEGVGEDPPQSDPDFLWLSTIRSHDQYNTTLYSMSDRYRGVFGQRDVVFLNEYEMEKRGPRRRRPRRSDHASRPTASSGSCATSVSSAIRSRTAAARRTIRRPIRSCRSMPAIPRASRRPTRASRSGSCAPRLADAAEAFIEE